MLFNDVEKDIINKILLTDEPDEIYNILTTYTNNGTNDFFKINEATKWHNIKYKKTKVNNKKIIYVGEVTNLDKKKILILYNKLIELIKNNIEYDIIDKLNKKYVNKLRTRDYDILAGWFNMLFILFIVSLLPEERNKYKFYMTSFNEKNFTRWAIEYNELHSPGMLIIKNILQNLNKLELPEELEQTIKIFSNAFIKNKLLF